MPTTTSSWLDDKAFITYDFCGLEVVDVSDPANMTQVAWLNPWNCMGLSWFGSDGHTNELITALGDSLLFVSGADSEILVYDITDPADPVLKGGHILPNDSAATWGVDVYGDLVVGNFINNHNLPLQPYDSKFGGVVLFNWEAEFATAVEEVDAVPPIHFGPNPTTGPLHFTGGGNAAFELYDAQGKMKTSGTIPAEASAIDLSSAPAGPYLLRILANGRPVRTEVIVVQR
jgi:hypothetical protein